MTPNRDEIGGRHRHLNLSPAFGWLLTRSLRVKQAERRAVTRLTEGGPRHAESWQGAERRACSTLFAMETGKARNSANGAALGLSETQPSQVGQAIGFRLQYIGHGPMISR